MRALFTICTVWVLAQAVPALAQTHTVRGYIRDADTGEDLIGANVLDRDAGLGATTNTYGFFSYTYAGDTLRLAASYIGYQPFDTIIYGDPLAEVLIELSTGAQLATVEVVAAEQSRRIDERVQMSKLEVPIEQIKRAPALLGETDVLKSLQLLPGVQSGSEGTAGLYVRGGSPDQNLILLDGVPVYNASHVLGIFSVFNADAINNVSLTKGGFPARYGGRLSSVLEINMKDGHKDEWHGEGGIGIISSRLTLNGPVGNKTRVLVSGRRTYLDLIAKPFVAAANRRDETLDTDFKLNFYDLNTKVRHELNDRHRLYFSGYLGGDVFGTEISETYSDGDYDNFDGGISWGNTIGAVRWNWEISPRLFSNATATFSDYAITFDSGFESRYDEDVEAFSALYRSGIRDYGLKYDIDFIPNPNHYLRFGASATHHTYSPGAVQFSSRTPSEAQDTTLGEVDDYGTEFFVYAEDEWRLSPKLSANVGVHFSGFAAGKLYTSLQPRLALRYRADNGLAYKASFANMAQYINLLTSEALSLPTDLWVPTTERIAPQRSWQVAAGVAKVWREKYEVSAEVYYKEMDNVVSYRPGASFIDFDPSVGWEDKVTQGDGDAYGLELLLQRKLGRTTGWIGYTLSWNNRTFRDINGGRTFPFRYDRRHDLSLLVSHKFSERVVLSGAYVFGTGNAYTLPNYSYGTDYRATSAGGSSQAQAFRALRVDQASEKNNYRMSNYQRLDLSIELIKQKRWGERAWVFGVYNAYWAKNPFFVLPRERFDNATGERTREYVEYSVLPVIPSVSYKFKF